jgi:hypothetical protein
VLRGSSQPLQARVFVGLGLLPLLGCLGFDCYGKSLVHENSLSREAGRGCEHAGIVGISVTSAHSGI